MAIVLVLKSTVHDKNAYLFSHKCFYVILKAECVVRFRLRKKSIIYSGKTFFLSFIFFN